MTVGDVVSGISGDNTILDFQPSSGVECVIVDWYSDNSGESPNMAGLTNGTQYVLCVFGGAATVGAYVRRIFVNNTRYLRIRAGGAGKYSGYSGVQTK